MSRNNREQWRGRIQQPSGGKHRQSKLETQLAQTAAKDRFAGRKRVTEQQNIEYALEKASRETKMPENRQNYVDRMEFS